MRGGAYLSLRQGLGVGIQFGGIILLTRAIGPAEYGLYAISLGIFMFLLNVSQWGTPVYLVRREGEDLEEVYHQAFTLLLLLGVAVTAFMVFAGIPLISSWIGAESFEPVALAMFLALPVALLGKIPLARLSRALNFRLVAIAELSGLAIHYAVALPLAFFADRVGLAFLSGAAAPVAGWWAQQTLMLVILFPAARYLPRLYWNNTRLKEMLHYGLSFSASMLVWQLRDLVNPLIVGRFLGVEAAGFVALAIRFVTGLAFIKEVTFRLSIAALAKVQGNRERLRRAVSEGMKLQLAVQGPLLVGFGWVALWIVPLLAGSEWRPVMQVYPFIALSYLVNGIFNLHSSALYVLQRNLDVVVFHSVHIALFAGSAFVLVPRMGLAGYGLAEVVALASYAVVHAYFVRRIGSPAYGLVAVWGTGAALALFVHELGWWTVLGPVAVLLWPRTWREIGGYAKTMLSKKETREA